ncbi:MAG: hypothetical protein ABW199_09535 [Caulobacterales bacterium]
MTALVSEEGYVEAPRWLNGRPFAKFSLNAACEKARAPAPVAVYDRSMQRILAEAEADRKSLEPFFTPFHNPRAIDSTYGLSRALEAIEKADLSDAAKRRYRALAEKVADRHSGWRLIAKHRPFPNG